MASHFTEANLKNLIDTIYPRLLSQIDHDPDSVTYGSCDRGYWMYRLHDFSSGIIQQGSLFFAYMAKNEKSSKAVCDFTSKLSLAINKYNMSIAHNDGSFDEYYPGEHSYVATAFTSYAILKSAVMLNQQDIIHHPKLRATFERFLNSCPTPAANQDVAYCAFAALYAQTHKQRIEETKKVIHQFLERKEFQGEFYEYGGVDLGYSSVSLNYLSYMHLDGFIDTKNYIYKLASQCVPFISKLGQFGGDFPSRSTSYFLPFGFYYSARLFPEFSTKISKLNLNYVIQKIDDRYLSHYLAPSLACTYVLGQQHPLTETQEHQGQSSDYGVIGASLFYYNSSLMNFYIGLNKGGAFYHESSMGKITHNSGHRVSTGGFVYSSSTLHDQNTFKVEETDNAIVVNCTSHLARYKTLTASPLKTMILRLLSFMGKTLNQAFKNMLIKKPQALSGVMSHRKIFIDKKTGKIKVMDKLEGNLEGIELMSSPASSFRLVPSAKFTLSNEEESYLTEKFSARLPWEKAMEL